MKKAYIIITIVWILILIGSFVFMYSDDLKYQDYPYDYPKERK